MPELPEVETIKSGLADQLVGHIITNVQTYRKKLRYAIPDNLKNALLNQKMIHFHRRGKYLLIDFQNNITLLIHLGMSGQLRITSCPKIHADKQKKKPNHFKIETLPDFTPHTHIVLITDQQKIVFYQDVRRFGFVDLLKTHTLHTSRWLGKLGPDPLQKSFNTAFLAKKIGQTKTSLKTVLMNQKYIAGLGNIYVCEALFRAKLSPFQTANSVTKHQISRLIKAIRSVLNEAITAGGSSLKDYVSTTGSPGYFQHAFQVYHRQGKPCLHPGCKGIIARKCQSGRSTYFCAHCQSVS